MYREEEEDTTIYKVVVNHEEQYSIWPLERENPLGWNDAGKSGSKTACLDYIQEVWTDMRPLSLRQQMEEQARQQRSAHQYAASPPAATAGSPSTPAMDALVQRLAAGNHPVVTSRAQNSVEELHHSITRGYVHIKFTETQGGTELGVRLDNAATDLSQADFSQARGTVHLVGTLTLNYIKIRCIANVDLATLQGTGHLEPVEQ